MSTIPTSTPPSNLPAVNRLFQQNAARIDTFVNDPAINGTYTTTGGVAVPTLPNLANQIQNTLDTAEALASAMGYQPPVLYAAGISLTQPSQTVEYNGQAYAPIASSLPFTTSGVFEATKFRLIQGVSSADLGASGGAALVGFQQNQVGAVLRTLQNRMRDFVSVKDFGAIGDGNEHPLSERFGSLSAAQAMYPFVTSLTQQIDWAAFQAAFNLAAGRAIVAPAGVYILLQPVAAAVASPNALVFTGSGAETTVLVFDSSDGFDITLSSFSRLTTVYVKGCTFANRGTGGVAINMIATATIECVASLRDLNITSLGAIHGNPGGETQWWSKGVYLKNCRYVSIDSVNIWGKEKNYINTGSLYGIHIECTTNNFGYVFNKLFIAAFDTAFRVDGPVEGIYGSEFEFWACAHCFVATNAGDPNTVGTIRLSNGHMAASLGIVDISDKGAVGLTNIEIYHGYTAGGTYGDAVLVSLNNCRNSNITGCKISSAFSGTNSITGVKVTKPNIFTIGGGSIIYSVSNAIIDIVGDGSYVNIGDGVYLGSNSVSTVGVRSTPDTSGGITGAVSSGARFSQCLLRSGDHLRIYWNNSYRNRVGFSTVGGSPTEAITLALPVGYFVSTPQLALLQLQGSESFAGLLFQYDFGASTPTSLRFVARTINGGNIVAGSKVASLEVPFSINT